MDNSTPVQDPARVPDPAVVVRAFLDALVAGDTDGAAALLADDVWWWNVGLPVLRGRRRVRGAIRSMHEHVRFGVETHHLAVEDPRVPGTPRVVLTERTDVLAKGRVSCRFWVCGRFEVTSDGRISGWKDHYSAADMALGLARGLLAAARGWNG